MILRKSIFKWVKRILLTMLIIIVVMFGIGYWYFSRAWRNIYTEEEVRAYVAEVNTAPTLPELFYGIYDKVGSVNRHQSMLGFSIEFAFQFALNDGKTPKYPSYLESARFFHNSNPKNHGRFMAYKLAWALEKYGNAEKCFDYAMMQRNQFLLEIDNSQPSLYQLRDTIDILKWIGASHNPTLYGHRPDLLEIETNQLYDRLVEE